jgi:multiple sugar transport system ATP-binding protein
MKDGYIQQIGTPRELYFDPVNVFVAGFIGEPPMNFLKGTVKDGALTFGAVTFDLTKKLGADAARYEGKELVLGFRPEGIVLGEEENAYRVPASVELTEMLGDNTNVYVDIADRKAILKVDPHDTPDIDSQIVFSIPLEHVYLFDGETERRI